MILAVIAIFTLATYGVGLDAESSSSDLIAPVKVTVKKLPDLGDPLELQRLKYEKLEAETREIERDELAIHRAVWINKQVFNYRFTVSTRGAWSGTEPVTVTVRGGRIVSTEYVCDPAKCKQHEVPPASVEPYDTVPNLFARIEDLLNHEMTLPRVQYDPQYGFPVNIANDRFAIADDEFTVTVWDFQLLE